MYDFFKKQRGHRHKAADFTGTKIIYIFYKGDVNSVKGKEDTCGLFSICGYLVPPVTVYYVLIICCMSIFLTASIAGIFLVSAIQKKVPENMLGRVMSFYMTIANCALLIGMALYGFMYEKLTNAIYLIMFVTALLIVLIGFSGKRTYYDLDT